MWCSEEFCLFCVDYCLVSVHSSVLPLSLYLIFFSLPLSLPFLSFPTLPPTLLPSLSLLYPFLSPLHLPLPSVLLPFLIPFPFRSLPFHFPFLSFPFSFRLPSFHPSLFPLPFPFPFLPPSRPRSLPPSPALPFPSLSTR